MIFSISKKNTFAIVFYFKMKYTFLIILLSAFYFSCKKQIDSSNNSIEFEKEVRLDYAKKIKIFKAKNYTRVQIENLASFSNYYFTTKKNKQQHADTIYTPIDKIVVTSTTDIPILEILNVEDKLIGFPQPEYISSVKTRKRIDANEVVNLGNNQQLNPELILELQPEVIVGFSINSNQSLHAIIEQSGTHLLMNASWQENHPLGRAEWIKLFGVLFNKEKQADSIFNRVKNNYLKQYNLVQQQTKKPTILSGNPYQGTWYVPGGKSYMATLIKHAGGNYLWASNQDEKSLHLNFESIILNAKNADYWIDAGNYKSIDYLKNNVNDIDILKAFKTKNIFTKDLKKGATGGNLFYEFSALHPDWVLSDLVNIINPKFAAQDTLYFYQKLH